MARSKLDAYADDICSLYRDGTPAGVIAKNYGVTTTTVTTFLKKLGLMHDRPRGWVSNDTILNQKGL